MPLLDCYALYPLLGTLLLPVLRLGQHGRATVQMPAEIPSLAGNPLDCCSPKAPASPNIAIIKVILTANIPVDVKVRLNS